jgi:hypothetical protein
MKPLWRRDFFGALGTFASTASFAARAQQPALPVIGFMSARSANDSKHLVAAFHKGLHDAGVEVGKDVTIEYVWADGQYDRLPGLASALVASRRIDLLLAAGGESSVMAARTASLRLASPTCQRRAGRPWYCWPRPVAVTGISQLDYVAPLMRGCVSRSLDQNSTIYRIR